MCFKKKKSAPAPPPKVEEPKTPVVTPPAPPEPPTGTTSVTPATVVKEPDKAAEEQERLAAEELRQKRIERARSKQSLLRKRLERTQEYGSGKKVLTGNERDLGAMASSSLITPSTGKRRGAGRRSLLTGSTGGIGFYSRYL
jgi:hypothetical protein